MNESITELIDTLRGSGKNYDLEKIKRAYDYASQLHEGQFRLSGEPYISHPLAVAYIVFGLGLDTDSICAALLHDTVEDCSDKTNIDIIRKLFGVDVAILVDGLTKLVQFPFEDKEEAHIENLRRMFLAMSKDIRVIFIKLCDRLHNMRTLMAKPEERRRVIALETMYVYAPLAHRLGIQKIKQELERLSLSYLDPIGYKEVEDDIEKKFGQNQGFLARTKELVSRRLEENNIRFTLEGRVKSVYSIYRKMYKQNKSFDEIYDFYAIRIIVDTELECYTALGIIHDAFNSIPGRFKDYISTPKPNNYRSLHTTVIGRDGIPFEVQIRTTEMHRVAEYGVAAHWKYKSGATSNEEIDTKLRWIAEFVEAENDTKDPEEFLNALKIDIFRDDEVYVFTPKGDVHPLPHGSTIIDFAYLIHTEIGNKMIGAKVNGMIMPIDHVLQNGEIVEIITSSSSKGPSRDWLKTVRTGEARNKIRQWFKREMRTENIAVGKADVEREFKKFGKTYTEAQKNEIVLNVARRIGIQDVEDAYNIIGYGGLTISKISGKLRDEFDRVVKTDVVEDNSLRSLAERGKEKHKRSVGGVIVDGVDGCAVKFSKCCCPIPGDDIIGFITKGFGISVHKVDCPNIRSQINDPNYDGRFVTAHWDEEHEKDNELYEATLCIKGIAGLGIMANVSSALGELHVLPTSVNMQNEGMRAVITMSLGCKNTEHLNAIMAKLRGVKDVEEVRRLLI